MLGSNSNSIAPGPDEVTSDKIISVARLPVTGWRDRK